MVNNSEISKRLAPEDIEPGTFVVVFSGTHERFPCFWESSASSPPPQPVRFVCLECADGEPLLVVAVCLPFVMTIDKDGDQRTLDVRQTVLARVSEIYGLEAFTRPDR